MASSGGIWAPIAIRFIKHAFNKTSKLVKLRLAKITKPLQAEFQPILARNAPKQSRHLAARIRQGQGRWYTTHSAIRRFVSSVGENAERHDRSSFPRSNTASVVSRLTSRAPFASTLRPNLTGGTLSRTSGGYTLGGGAGGARFFSHAPAAPAQVVSNVSAACRAFWLSGQKAEFNGMTSKGEKQYRGITALQEQTYRELRSAPDARGSFIEFNLSPTVTALSHLTATNPAQTFDRQSMTNLNTEGFLDVLSVDFARALKDHVAIMNDLKRLSTLGDLPITLENNSILKIGFPGCDAESVERLCDEAGVQRGIIRQDIDFSSHGGGQVALMFPFASTSEYKLSSPAGTVRSQTGHEVEPLDEYENPWLEGYESMYESDEASFTKPSQLPSSSDFEGVEGIYRFLEQCNDARRI